MIMRAWHCRTLVKGALLPYSIPRGQTCVTMQTIATWSALPPKLVILVVVFVILIICLQMERQVFHLSCDFDTKPVP